MYFYAVYVAVVFLILRLHNARAATIAAIGFGMIVAVTMIVTRHELSAILNWSQLYVPDYIDLGVSFEHSFYRWLFYFSPYARIFEFLLGCLTAHAFILLRPRPVSTYEQQSANFPPSAIPSH